MINRVGRKCTIKSIQLRGMVYIEAALNITTVTAVNAQWGLWFLIWDMQPNGAVPAIADIFNVPGSNLSMINLNNRDRFKILKRDMITMDPFVNNAAATLSVAGFNNTTQYIDCYLRVNLETIFNSTNGGTIADISSGALHFVHFGSLPSGANADMAIQWTSRVRFDDA